MAKHSKEEITDSENSLREYLAKSAEECGTYPYWSPSEKREMRAMHVVIVWRGGRPTSTGRTDYYDVFCFRKWDGQVELCRLTYSVHVACGFAMGRGDYRDHICIGGCGFSKPYEIVERLQKYAPEGVALTDRLI